MKIGFETIARKIFRQTTIEPSVLFLNMSVIISNFLYTNLYLQKSCRFNATQEPDLLSSSCDDEKAGQRYVTEMNAWRQSIGMALMMVFTIYASSWSEKNDGRRRPLLFLPQFGQIIVTAAGCLNTFFWQWPVVPNVILEILTYGVTGARFLMGNAAQMYLCDLTADTNRTARLGVLTGLHVFVVIVGNGLAGFMTRRLGLFVSFCIDCVLAISGVISGFIFIKDSTKSTGTNLPFWKPTNPTMVHAALEVVCKKRTGKKRILIWTLLLIDATTLFVLVGESSVLYLYLRYRFGWNEEDYSIYMLFKLLIMTFGTLFSTVILNKYFGVRNAALGLLSSVLSLMAVVCFSTASKSWQLWSYGTLEVLRASTVTIISSLVIECLDENESGHLMALRCILGFITPLCFPTYNYVYRSTMDSFPSAFFLISCVVYLLQIILFGLTNCWIIHSHQVADEIPPRISTGTRD